MDHTHEITEVPEAARVVTMALSMITISVLAICLTRRIQMIKNWKSLPLTNIRKTKTTYRFLLSQASNHLQVIIAIYIDSFLFIFCTAVLSKAYSLNQSAGICDGAILLCLLCYMTTKIMIYYFLVEKVHIIRTASTSRFKSKLWLFNFFGVICPYVVLVVLNFVFRIAYINERGVCVIGMKRRALVPLITFDIVLNVYLTSLFLHPLRQCYTFKQGTKSSMRILVVRTFVGSCATLLMSVVNLSVLTILDGEPGYICLCLCNLDILFTVCVLHWATAIDRQDRSTTSGSLRPNYISESRGASNSTHDSKADNYLELDERYVAKLTTYIEANGEETPNSDARNSRVIEVKTQHVREVAMEPYDIESGNCRESQENIVKPSSL
ncbi:hypothetical protein E4T51_06765 [Aureobasidium sp. EXF-12344]|nr:hypothetical protein E4T51_06765 [Aureobasidium sp. EXF-12344]